MRNQKMMKSILSLVLLATTCQAVDVYFSPRGGIKDRIIQEIRKERSSIRAALYFLTDKDIVHEFAKASKRGVSVEIICDQGTMDSDWGKVEFLVQQGIPVHIYNGGKKSLMHDKFWIFGGSNCLITGSFNPTRRGDAENCENIVVFGPHDDPSVIRKFDAEFVRIRERCKRWAPEQSSWGAWTRGLTAWA
jgi:phosphatidylserine/phosphatidylglycerophosphate/cardiolipin synthase-like enzyme